MKNINLIRMLRGSSKTMKKARGMLLLCTLLLINAHAWGTTTQIFNMTTVSSHDDVSVARKGGTLDLTVAGGYLSSLTGGSVTLANYNTSSGTSKMMGTDSKRFQIYLGENTNAVILTLDNALAEGDVISFTSSKSNQISFGLNSTRVTTPATTSNSYTIPAKSTLIGESTIYIWRSGGSGVYIETLTIAREDAGGGGGGGCTSHSVNLSSSGSMTGGTFATSSATVCEEETATLTATPAAGYEFTSWSATGTGCSLSSTTTNPATLTMGTADVTVGATFTKVYVPAGASYNFVNQGDGSVTWGSSHTVTLPAGTKTTVPAGSRVDNIFFSTALDIEYEKDAEAGTGYKGWKIKQSGKLAFYVENDCDVIVTNGIINGMKIHYYNQSNVETNTNLTSTAGTREETAHVKGGTLFEIVSTTTSTNTLKGIRVSSSCTAPNHVDVTPTSEAGNYGWRYSIGETLKLTATPYSSAGTGSPITTGITGYQWQKYVTSDWVDLEDDSNISGATTANLQISNLATTNGGSYRCKISTGATCTTASDGYFVRIFTLYGGYSGGAYSHQKITWTGEKRGTVTIDLNASSSYKFKFTDNNNRWFGNGGTISSDFATEDDAVWGFGTSAGDATLSTGSYGGGNYVLTVDITHFDDGGDKYVNLRSTVYPKKTTYLQLCSDWKAASAKYAIYYYNGGTNGWTDFMTAFACDGDILSAEVPVWATNAFFVRFDPAKTSTGNFDYEWNRSGDNESTLPTDGKDYYNSLSKGGNGQYYGSWGTYSVPTYTVTTAVSPAGYGTVSAASVSSVACGTSISASTSTLTVGATTVTASPADATAEYTYAFDSWSWSPSGATVTSAVTATANFTRTPKSYTLKWDLAGGTVSTAGTGAAKDATGTPSSSVAFGTALTAPGVTKTGYNFNGWDSDVASTMPAANTTYTATWTVKTTTITINANTANHGSTTPGTVTATWGSALPSFTAAAGESGWSLTGYFTEATSGTKVINADGTLVASTDYADGSGNWKYETATLTLYAQYEETSYCYEYEIATSGSETGLYDLISGSGDGEMEVIGTNGSGSFGYNSYGIKFNNSKDIISIALPNKIKEGTQVEIKQYATGNGSARGLELQTSGGTKVADIAWDPAASAEEKVITYTVGSGNALIDANVFRLKRKTNTYLKSVKVGNCGSAATTYNVLHTLSHVSFSSGIDAGTGAVLAGGNYTAIFEADDCYTLPSTITVTIGGDAKTVNDDYKWDSSTGKLVIWGAKVTGAIVVTITGVDNHIDPALAYETDAVAKITDDAAFTNTLTNTYGVTVSYESSDKDVATVDSDGEVTIVGAGTCTITASADAQDCYTADNASYTLTVTSCTAPTASWSTTPANGIVGGSMTAAVTTNYSDGLVYSVTGATPSGCVTINSSGVISYVKPGTATVKATVTGDGTTYCVGPTEITQAIKVHNPQVDDDTYAYYYSDETHFDGANTYKNPEGNTPGGSDGDNTALTSPWTIRNSSFMDGLTSIVATNARYDKKNNHINAYIKLRQTDGGKIVFTITEGYKATIKIKMGGYSGKNESLTMKLDDSGDNISYTGSMAGKAETEDSFAELTYADLAAGAYTLKPTSGSLYISQIDIETTLVGYAITNGSPSGGTIAITDGSSPITVAAENATVYITATPSTGYDFTSWNVTKTSGGASVTLNTDDDSDNKTRNFTMPGEAVTVNATFTAINYTITHSAASNGTYTIKVGSADAVSTNTTANYGQTITLAASPDSHYALQAWNVTCGGDPVAVTNNQFSMPAGNVTIAPTFGAVYTVTFNSNGGSAVDAIEQSTVGGAITMPDAPTKDDYTFVNWMIGSTTKDAGDSYTPTANVTAYATWKSDDCAGGGEPTVLFSQNFSGSGSLTYTQEVAYTKASGLAGIVGDGDNLFTSITTSNKNSTGIAINHASGGHSVNASGIFQADFLGNSGGYWSVVRTNDFATSAPAAIKVTMDVYCYNNNNSKSNVLVHFAVGDGFSESLKGSTVESTDNIHSGWGITNEAYPYLCAYNTYGTKIYATALSYQTWYSITWIVNNTGESLTYDNPTGSGTTTLANDKYDIWLKTQAGAVSTYAKVASAVSATTASKALQELYIGHNTAGSQHEFRMDNIVVTDISSGSGGTCYTVTYNGNGADGGYANDPTAYDDENNDVTVLANGFTRTGYEFVGWNTAANGSGETYQPGATITDIDDDVTLYAQWRVLISSDNTNFSDYTSVGSTDDVRVANGATLTLTESKTIHDIIIEPGATLNVSTNSGSAITLTVNSLALHGGWTTINEESVYDMPRIYIDPKSTLTKTSSTVNFDIAVDARNYYPIALPFDVNVNDVNYVNSTLATYVTANRASCYGTYFAVKEYDGQNRADNGPDQANNWDLVGNDKTLTAGKGYILSAVTVSGLKDADPYAVIRFPMTVDNAWTAGGEKGSVTISAKTYTKNVVPVEAYTGDAATANKCNAGWNMLGVPYMSCFGTNGGLSGASIIEGRMVISDGTISFDEDGITYVNVPTHDFSEYLQYDITEEDTHLRPGWCFLVQIEDGESLTFAVSNQEQSSSLPIYAPALRKASMPTFKTGIVLSGAEASDKTTILVSDKYSAAAYEINADLEKMFGNGYTLATYSIAGNTRLAYNAMSKSDAMNIIPIGYRAPADGEYTFSINSRYAESAFERVELVDYQEGITTNLLLSSYTFTTARMQNDSRFALNIVPKAETPSGLEDGELLNGDASLNGVQKVLYKDHIYIIREGKIYGVDGAIVK